MSEKEVEKVMEQGIIEYFKLSSKISTSNMMCFDAEGKIKKYNSPEEITEDFFAVRLAYYQKRKASFTYLLSSVALTSLFQDYLANDLQSQVDKLSNQARFVQMIITRELVVSNRKKADVVAELRKKEFKPIPKVAKKKAVGDIEEEVDEDEEEEEVEAGNGQNVNSTDFDYLLGMAIYSLTKEKASLFWLVSLKIFSSCTASQIAKLLQQRDEKERELVALLKRTAVDIWTENLDTFLVEWEVFILP